MTTIAAVDDTACEPPIETLKGIAAWLGEFWGRPGPPVEVSTFQVLRAARRRRDPLPTYKPLGRRFAIASELRAWAMRQGAAQVELMLAARAKPQ